MLRGIVLFAQVSVVICLCARLAGFRLPAMLLWTVAVVAYAAAGLFSIMYEAPSYDARIFWNAGRDILEGQDPYARPEFLNPPTALPFFVLFALLPLSEFLWMWKIAALVGYGVIVPACHAALRMTFDANRLSISHTDLALLAGAVVISVTARFGILLGQIPILIALAAIGAIAAHARSRPVSAGIFLAFTSIKPTTMIPFLLLFPPKAHVKAWATMVVTGFLLALTLVHPSDLWDTLQRNLQNIRNSSLPGAVNDYTFTGPNVVDLISLEYAIYHLGFRARTLITAIHFAAVGSLGALLAWQIYRRPAINFAAAASIIACFSTLFIYHRQYDAVILVVPLIYCFSMVHATKGRKRWIYGACTLAIIGVLNEPMGIMGQLIPFAQGSGILNRLVEALLLPVATWVIITISITLSIVERGGMGKCDPNPE